MSCDLQANEITGCTHNVPRRLSRQCVGVPGDSKLINMQAGGNTCPAELPDDPSPLCARLWRCGQSRNSVSVQSMPNNMQAGGNTCPAGPLGDAASLPNSPRRCGRQCIPDSFFLSSLNEPRRCGRQCVPDSFFSPSNLPRCSDRRRISLPSSSSCRLSIIILSRFCIIHGFFPRFCIHSGIL